MVAPLQGEEGHQDEDEDEDALTDGAFGACCNTGDTSESRASLGP
jgi:hypothetical protein